MQPPMVDPSFILINLGAIALVALTFGIIASHFRQNSSLGYILAGVLLGPLLLHFIMPGAVLGLVGDLGIVFILFYLGLELNLKRIREGGAVPFVMAAVQMVLSFAGGFIVAKLFGLPDLSAAVVGAVLISTSTVMVARFLLDRNLLGTPFARLALSHLMLQDFLGIFALVFISSLSTQGSLNLFVLNALLYVIAMFFLVSKASRHILNFLHSLGHGDKMVFYAIGVGVISAYVGAALGLSTTLGAYFAGFALAESAFGDRIKRDLGMFREFFILFFFVGFGATLFFDPAAGIAAIPGLAQLIPILLLAIVLTLVYLLTTLLAYLVFGPLVGLDAQTAAAVSTLLIPLGEFVIIILTAARPLLTPSDLALLLPTSFLLILFTAPLGPIFFDHSESVARIFSSLLPSRVRRAYASAGNRIRSLAHLFDNPLLQDEYVLSVERMLRNLVIAFSLVYIGVLLRRELQGAGSLFFPSVPAPVTAGFILLLAVTWPLYKFVSELRFLVEIASRSFIHATFPAVARSTQQVEDEIAEVFTGVLLTAVGLAATIAVYYAFPSEILYVVIPVAYTMLALMHLSRSFYALIEHFESLGEPSLESGLEPRDRRLLSLTREFEEHARQFRTLHTERERLKEHVRDAIRSGNTRAVRTLLTQFKRREEKLMDSLRTSPSSKRSRELIKLTTDTKSALEAYLLAHAADAREKPAPPAKPGGRRH